MRIIITSLIVSCLFYSCEEIESNSPKTKFEESGDLAFYRIMLNDMAEAMNYYSFEILDLSRDSKVKLPEIYGEDCFKLHWQLYKNVTDIIRPKIFPTDTIDEYQLLIDINLISDSILRLKLPFSHHMKMIDIQNEIEKTLENPISKGIQTENFDRLIMTMHDYAWKQKINCSKRWYSGERNTGSMIVIESKNDMMNTFHCGVVVSKQDVILTLYNLKGVKVKEDFYNSVDSIYLKSADTISVVKLTYPERFNFIDYVKINEVDRDILDRILTDKKDITREKWLKEFSDMLFFNMLADETYLNGKHHKAKRNLYRFKEQFEYNPGKKRSFEDVKEVLYTIDRSYISEGRSRILDPFDTVVNPPFDYDKGHMRHLLSFDKGEKEIHPIEFFYLSRSVFDFRGRGWQYCWGCTRQPNNLYFSLFKRGNGTYTFFTRSLLVFNEIQGITNVHKTEFENHFNSMSFPIKQEQVTPDGRIFETDSIYKDNLYYFSTN